jgi:hypothetical protein
MLSLSCQKHAPRVVNLDLQARRGFSQHALKSLVSHPPNAEEDRFVHVEELRETFTGVTIAEQVYRLIVWIRGRK